MRLMPNSSLPCLQLLFSSFSGLRTHRPKPPGLKSQAFRTSPTRSLNNVNPSRSQFHQDQHASQETPDPLWSLSMNPNSNVPTFGAPSSVGCGKRLEDLFASSSSYSNPQNQDPPEVEEEETAIGREGSEESEGESPIEEISKFNWPSNRLNPFSLRSRVGAQTRTSASLKKNGKARRRSDEMDWTPTSQDQPQMDFSRSRKSHQFTNLQFGPQRFFAAEPPTGLEDLFGSALALSEEGSGRKKSRNGLVESFGTKGVVFLSLVVLVAVFGLGFMASSNLTEDLSSHRDSYERGRELGNVLTDAFGFLRREGTWKEPEVEEGEANDIEDGAMWEREGEGDEQGTTLYF